MVNQTKLEMKSRVRLAKGLINLLKDDVDVIAIDVDDYNLFTIGESIREAKDTIQKLVDNLTELEYLTYLSKQPETRN